MEININNQLNDKETKDVIEFVPIAKKMITSSS